MIFCNFEVFFALFYHLRHLFAIFWHFLATFGNFQSFFDIEKLILTKILHCYQRKLGVFDNRENGDFLKNKNGQIWKPCRKILGFFCFLSSVQYTDSYERPFIHLQFFPLDMAFFDRVRYITMESLLVYRLTAI